MGLQRDVAAGTKLDASMLITQHIPDRFVESRHIPADQTRTLVGLRVGRALRGNESLRDEQVLEIRAAPKSR